MGWGNLADLLVTVSPACLYSPICGLHWGDSLVSYYEYTVNTVADFLEILTQKVYLFNFLLTWVSDSTVFIRPLTYVSLGLSTWVSGSVAV